MSAATDGIMDARKVVEALGGGGVAYRLGAGTRWSRNSVHNNDQSEFLATFAQVTIMPFVFMYTTNGSLGQLRDQFHNVTNGPAALLKRNVSRIAVMRAFSCIAFAVFTATPPDSP